MIKRVEVYLNKTDTMFSSIQFEVENSIFPVDGLKFYKIVCYSIREYLQKHFIENPQQVTQETENWLAHLMEELSQNLLATYHVDTLPYNVQIVEDAGRFVLNLEPVDIYALDTPYIKG